MKFTIISGQSGAGKSVALHALEDLGFYGVDNLPLRLLPALVQEFSGAPESGIDRLAAVVDVRSPDHDLNEFGEILNRIHDMGIDVEVVFLEAARDVLLKRFSETRRRHPLTHGELPLAEALERETRMLQPLLERAALRIDTSRLNLHQLRTQVQERVGQGDDDALSLLLQSFGFKHGAPRDADMVYDMRCLPNPYWEPALRGLTGRDRAVEEFLESSPLVRSMREDLAGFLDRWLPQFRQEKRAYLSVAIGCTGGRHRSVYMVEWLAGRLRQTYPNVIVRHQELKD
jgi:UPF0042 nucleotide-binding protein